ncbi:MAG: hypothetical protein LBL33_07565 [Tannerella sp.]|jgi:hypothetical protein|nr:hypothetical protein [Tannerella sp.]
MKTFIRLLFLLTLTLPAAAGTPSEATVRAVIEKLSAKNLPDKSAMEKGVRQVARLWQETDGNAETFESFCLEKDMSPSAAMKGQKARLRTRIPADGMNYKGYNIAIHEFGHNVKQTIMIDITTNRPIRSDIYHCLSKTQVFKSCLSGSRSLAYSSRRSRSADCESNPQ